MTKFQLFKQKNGQLAVGNRYAIYNTLAEAQTELRRWLRLEYGKNDNICYIDDSIIAEGKIDGIGYNDYTIPGWYKYEGCYYDVVNYDFYINADDFTEFSYDMTKYFIEEIEVK